MENTLAIHQSKNSETVVRFITAEQTKGLYGELIQLCSHKYAKRIIAAMENGQLWGAYLTKTGRIKAAFNL
jgi:hypothetical protein